MLVVDKTNFTDEHWISAGGRVSFHSDALRIIRRFTAGWMRTRAGDGATESEGADHAVGEITADSGTSPFDQIHGTGCFR